jgi:hypothetical protein
MLQITEPPAPNKETWKQDAAKVYYALTEHLPADTLAEVRRLLNAGPKEQR